MESKAVFFVFFSWLMSAHSGFTLTYQIPKLSLAEVQAVRINSTLLLCDIGMCSGEVLCISETTPPGLRSNTSLMLEILSGSLETFGCPEGTVFALSQGASGNFLHVYTVYSTRICIYDNSHT